MPLAIFAQSIWVSVVYRYTPRARALRMKGRFLLLSSDTRTDGS